MIDRQTPDDGLQAVLAQMQTDEQDALASLGDLARLYPDDPRLPFLTGSILAGQGRYAEARQAMQSAIRIAPDYALARFQLGLLELSSGLAEAAQATWAPLLDLPADQPLNLFVRGLHAMIGNDFAAAIALLEDGMARNAGLPPMNRDMGLMVAKMREALADTPAGDDVASDAHFLLKQYSFKDTKH